MKKLSIILATVMLLAISYSCSEDFLDKQPLGSTSETVFYNEKGIDALLIGTYGVISGSALWNVSWGSSIQNWTYGSAASDDAYKGSELSDQVPVNDIERWEVSTTNNYPADKWLLNIGMGVNRANEVLRIISLTEDLSDEMRSRLTAEARFLRALFNFEAWLVFGDMIPILTEETEDPKLVTNENPAGAVLQHIISDLQYAWENLPETQSQVGRPTLYAAKALAARAYLQELDYISAKPLLDDVIAGPFSLMPNFHDNYKIATNNNSESIFEIQANVNDINESLNAEMGIGLNWPHGADIGMCCGFHQPSQNLVNAFRVDADGLPMFDTFNDTDLKNDQGVASNAEWVPFTDEVDPRLDWTVGRRGIPYLDWGIMRGRDWIRYQPNGGPYMPALKPFFYKSERYSLSTTTGWMTGVNANNYRYLRLGHILLWRAEVAAFEGEFSTATDLVNQIRARADNQVVMGKVLIDSLSTAAYPWGYGLWDEGTQTYLGTTDEDYLTGGDVDWSLPAANYNIGEYEIFTSKADAMRAVQWELRLEFATEGMRFFDLRRWDNLPAEINSQPMVETLNAFALGDLRIRTFMNGATFTERDKYQPIPQNQINLQPDVLKQNPGY
ncbi:MAG: RagB/SusD family nutrient uptake outer membrane protein [Bacteroidales bacterium]